MVTTVGRGNHSVCTHRWKYIHYFDGSEELYDLEVDPHEWFNLASESKYRHIKSTLTRHIPTDSKHKQYVRWGRWKAVLQTDGTVMLFDILEPFGISEQNEVAEANPEVTAKILDYVKKNEITARYLGLNLKARNPNPRLPIMLKPDSTLTVVAAVIGLKPIS